MPRTRSRSARCSDADRSLSDRPRRRGPYKRIRFLLLTQLTCSGCFSATPFQSARVTEPDQRTGTMSYQRSKPRDGSKRGGWVMIEGGTRIPLSDGKVDLGLGGAFYISDPASEDGYRFGGVMFGLGPKFEVVNDVLAIELPARFTFAGSATLHTTHFYPRAILSLPVSDVVEVNLSATKFIFPGTSGEMPWGYSAGLALGKRGGAIFRPEIGVLDYPQGGDMIQFGFAYTPEFKVGPTAPSTPLPPATERTPR